MYIKSTSKLKAHKIGTTLYAMDTKYDTGSGSGGECRALKPNLSPAQSSWSFVPSVVIDRLWVLRITMSILTTSRAIMLMMTTGQQSPTECPFNGDQVIRTAADCLRPINFNVNMLGCLAMYSSNNNTFRPYYHPHPPWHAAPIPLTRVQY